MQLEPIQIDPAVRQRANVVLSQRVPINETAAVRPLEELEREQSNSSEQQLYYERRLEEAQLEELEADLEAQRIREQNEAQLMMNLDQVQIDQSARLAEALSQERIIIIGTLVVDISV
jgi:multidrug efflux pump subunit AcrA (membrane-fusion protein)